jgi:hypothetical protein
MCCDLNRCLYYSDREGLHLEAPEPVKKVLTVIDAVVGGEGEGPLAPVDVPLGVVMAGLDPIGVDVAAVRLMGFDEEKLEKLSAPMRDAGPRITKVRSGADVRIHEVAPDSFEMREYPVDEIRCDRVFEPHAGWVGHVELARSLDEAVSS